MELFGPDFERYEEVQGELNRIAEVEKGVEAVLTNAEHSTPDAGPVDKSKAKKGKVAMKSTGLAYQFQIYRRASFRNQKLCGPSVLVVVFPSYSNGEYFYTKPFI